MHLRISKKHNIHWVEKLTEELKGITTRRKSITT